MVLFGQFLEMEKNLGFWLRDVGVSKRNQVSLNSKAEAQYCAAITQ